MMWIDTEELNEAQVVMEKKKYLNQCAQLLISQNLTIAFVESATAGRMASEFSLCKNAGSFLKGGLVCYDAGLKEDILKVPHALLEKYTPESFEVTKAITEGLPQIISANIHIGITGLPTSGGSETKTKPVGTMFLYGIHNGKEIINEKVKFKGSPEEIILSTVIHIAKVLTHYLKTFERKN